MNSLDWTSTYHYDPLDYALPQFRLLTLLPAADRTEDISCSLEIASLDQEGLQYEALSYTWGDASIQHKIFIGRDILSINQNLNDALRRLRLQDGTRILWVDAICIDQSDISQRNHQVALMGSIFSKAQLVIAWLGEESDESDHAMGILAARYEASNLIEYGLLSII
jgi:hypothetical protein